MFFPWLALAVFFTVKRLPVHRSPPECAPPLLNYLVDQVVYG